MSRHHRAQRWTTDSPKFRKTIQAMLPQPCVNCGRPVLRTDRWHVGHRPGHDAHLGKRAQLQHVGPAHALCNLRDGGRTGARIVNARRQASKDIRPW